MSSVPLLELEGVAKRFGGVQAPPGSEFVRGSPSARQRRASLAVGALLWIGMSMRLTAWASSASPLGPDHIVRHWHIEDGLPHSSVLSMAQTPDGYLWLATFGGLARFDGVRFTVFDTGNVPCLPASRLVGLCADREGALWIVTEYGDLARLRDGQCQAFTPAHGVPDGGWEQFTVVSGLTTLNLRSVLCDREGSVWVGTDGGGLMQIRPRPWRMITRREGLGVDAVHSVSQDQSGRVWFAGGTGQRLQLRPEPRPLGPWAAQPAPARLGAGWASDVRVRSRSGNDRGAHRPARVPAAQLPREDSGMVGGPLCKTSRPLMRRSDERHPAGRAPRGLCALPAD